MLKNRLHTAVILATAAVAPLSLEASFKSLFCHTTEDQRTATAKAPATDSTADTSAQKTPFKSKLIRFLGLNKTQRAKTISAQDNTADAHQAKLSMVQPQFLWTQPGSDAYRSQHGLPSRENTASADTLSLTPPAVKQEEDTGNVTESSAPASPSPALANAPTNTPSPAPRTMTELFTRPLNLPASVGVDIEQVRNHETPPQTTESSADSIRWSTILPPINPFLTSPQQPTLEVSSEDPETKPGLEARAELASLSESSEETQQATESPEEVSEKDPKKAQFDPVIAQLSQQFAAKQQISENPQN